MPAERPNRAASDDSPQDGSAPLVAGDHPIGHQESQGLRVVGYTRRATSTFLSSPKDVSASSSPSSTGRPKNIGHEYGLDILFKSRRSAPGPCPCRCSAGNGARIWFSSML